MAFDDYIRQMISGSISQNQGSSGAGPFGSPEEAQNFYGAMGPYPGYQGGIGDEFGNPAPTSANGSIGDPYGNPAPPPPAAPAAPAITPGPVITFPKTEGTVTIPSPGYPGGDTTNGSITPTIPNPGIPPVFGPGVGTDTGATANPSVSPAGGTNTGGTLGFGEGLGVDWFTGANANLLTDPASKYNPNTAEGKSYYNSNPSEAAYAALFQRYGPLNALGDNFRAYLMQTASRAAAQQSLRNQLAGPQGTGNTYADIAGSLSSGDIYMPAANRSLLGQLVSQASGGNRLTQEYLTDPTNRRDILNAALWGISPSNPYFDYLQRNLNRFQQGQQVGGTWLEYLRQMGII